MTNGKGLFLISVIQLSFMLICSAQPGGLTIEACIGKAQENYPLIKRYDLISKAADYTIENLRKGYLPQVSVSAQASYQSSVTSIPVRLQAVEVPSLNKDQYKAYAQLDQLIYDGGTLRRQEELQKKNRVVAEQQLDVDMYSIRERINQLFFGILMADEQLKQNDLLTADLWLGLNKVRAAVTNGTAYRSNADLLDAEILKVRQRTIEIKASRKAYADMLALFTGLQGGEDIQLLRPVPPVAAEQINRPELAVFETQNKQLDIQDKLLTSGTLPKIGLFLQGGYARPGLDMLRNEFQAYYIGGIRLNWSPSGFYTLKRQRALLSVNRQEIQVNKETFLFNTSMILKQQHAEISKFNELSATDDEIIALRKKVKEAAIAQLDNGVITGSDFLKEVNNEDQAIQTKLLHQTQLLLARYSQRNTTGDKP